ncbi:uncharacterized protein [Rhodnius prolixus]|uniref:uncharacterized protein n=1 Tax=Rhodnius prolixus TaxID=13249 RepID=UPI003D18D649
MDVGRLNKDELQYEARVRRLSDGGSVEELRKKLRPILKLEREGKAVFPTEFTSTLSELGVCREKVQTLKARVAALGDLPAPGDIKRIDTGLQHVTSRINRIRPMDTDKESWKERDELADECAYLWACLEECRCEQEGAQGLIGYPVSEGLLVQPFAQERVILAAINLQVSQFTGSREGIIGRQLEGTIAELLSKLTLAPVGDQQHENTRLEYLKEAVNCLQTFNEHSQIQLPSRDTHQTESPAATGVSKRKQIPMKEWGVKFSGDGQGLSVHAFLEAIEEMKVARNTNDDDLFASAYDLFTGRALIWYKAIRREATTWDQVVQEMKAEFEPQDYTERLWEEIRARTQGDDEPMGIFIAIMRNYFHRLPTRPSETEMLRVVMRNLHPYYLDRLSLHEVSRLDDLVEKVRRIEATRWRIQTHRPPPSRRSVLEPDLAYSPISRRVAPALNLAEAPTGSLCSRDSSSDKCPMKGGPERPKIRGTCWNCDQPGHSHRWCKQTKNPFCERCGTKEVTTEESTCPQKRETPVGDELRTQLVYAPSVRSR